MKKILLGITEQGHQSRAETVQSSVRGMSLGVWGVLVAAAAGWAAHALELIPSFGGAPEPPAQFLRAVGLIDSPNLGSGFMVDEKHFLTTKGAIGGNPKKDDPLSVRFPLLDDKGKFQQVSQPVAGKVKWVSADKNGFRLVLVEMAEPRLDYAKISLSPFAEKDRCPATGFDTDSGGKTRLKTEFTTVSTEDAGFSEVVWGNKETPLYEGFPISSVADFSVKGLLCEGIGVVPIAMDELIQAGASPEN